MDIRYTKGKRNICLYVCFYLRKECYQKEITIIIIINFIIIIVIAFTRMMLIMSKVLVGVVYRFSGLILGNLSILVFLDVYLKLC